MMISGKSLYVRSSLMLFSALLGLCVAMSTSCHRAMPVDSNVDNQFIEDDYSIAFEDALQSLENFLISKGMVATKSDFNTLLADSFVVYSNESQTKSSLVSQKLLYAVNLKDAKGYALLSADSRIGEDIIAMTDSGNICEGDFDPIDDIVNNDYEDNNDISEEEYKNLIQQGALGLVSNRLINRQCLQYAENKILADRSFESDARKDNETTPPYETFSWVTRSEVPMMIRTLWTQETTNNDIFNIYCPMVGCKKKKKAPTGCVSLALGQIMAYHEYPDTLYDGDKLDWGAIKKIYSYDDKTATGQQNYYRGTDASRSMLSHFLYDIGKSCNTIYFYFFDSYGFAFPTSAEKCMKAYGYKNVKLHWGYNEGLIIDCLDAGCPVFFSATSTLLAIGGHAWVIDGYMKRDCVSNMGRIKESQTLVHCNWGWSGNCNGYFTSGVFKISEPVIADGIGSSDSKDNYWHLYNFITYDKPDKQ